MRQAPSGRASRLRWVGVRVGRGRRARLRRRRANIVRPWDEQGRHFRVPKRHGDSQAGPEDGSVQLDSPLLSAASFPLAARPKRQSFSQTVFASDQGGSQSGVCQSDIFAARFASQFAQQPHSPTCRQNCSGGPRLVVSVRARASFHVCVFASVSRACACVTVCCVCACIYARVSVYCVPTHCVPYPCTFAEQGGSL